MSQSEPVIRNISDTARWAAVYRAREAERPDALFRDPFARRLAGERGEQIAATLPFSDRHTWSWITRTWLFDQIIAAQVKQGVDMVVNLAAGLDARPYRMTLLASLKWVEVDLPGILDYKEEILAKEKPACVLQRVRLDLSDRAARCDLFDRLGREAKKVLIISEGFLTYLPDSAVGELAKDLAGPASFQQWVLEIASPGLLQMLQKNMGAQLRQGGLQLKFGPPEGPGFFTRYGWKPLGVRSMLKTAASLRRLPLWMRLLALLPESSGPQGARPWSAVCLFTKKTNQS